MHKHDADQVDAAMAHTIEKRGLPIILVNTAGGVFWSPLLDTAPKGGSYHHPDDGNYILGPRG